MPVFGTGAAPGQRVEERNLSQISLPWTAPDAEVRRAYRGKATTLLLVLGALCLAFALIVFFAVDFKASTDMESWRVLPAWLGVVGPGATGLALVAGGLAVVFYRKIGALLQWWYVAAIIFFGGVFAVCLIVWAHAGLFRLMEEIASNTEINQEAATILGGELTAQEIRDGIAAKGVDVPFFAYLLYPLQSALVRDLVATGGIIGFISIIPGFGIWWERKVAGRIQSRLGPMRVGGWHGWAQSPADAIKLIFKEDLVPAEGDAILYRLAPYLALVPSICLFIALPFATSYVFRDLDVALIFILAMLGIEVVGVILAGWASNNKWSVYGAMREACQMVSYEIPMGMALLIPIMMAGSLKLTTIADAQAGGFWNWFVFANPWCFMAFFGYYTAALASCKRAPFDLPESESELVAGFLTEYSGFRWSIFFFAEYAAMFAVSGLAVILFLGGWTSPLPGAWAPTGEGWGALVIRGLFFDGPILFVLKGAFMFYVQLWIRWTLPRIRIDQVLYGCVQVLLPLMMAALLFNTIWILGVHHLAWAWMIGLDAILHWLLVAFGVAVAIAMVGIASYGFANRRRLPGPLVIEHLPGS